MAPIYGWGSTASRYSHFEEVVYYYKKILLLENIITRKAILLQEKAHIITRKAIVSRVVLVTLFYEDPYFSNVVQLSNCHPYRSFCFPVSLAERVIMPHLMYYFT